MDPEQHLGISFGKVRTWHDGLGEFSLQLGHRLAAAAPRWRDERGIRFHFHLPHQWHGHFGPDVSYLSTHDLQRWVHWQPQRFALWHSLHQHNPFQVPLRTVHRLQTVHDANFLYLKHGAKRQRYVHRMRRQLSRCDEVIAISRHVQSDLQDKLGCTTRMRVIYNGVRNLSGAPTEAIDSLQGVPFLLHVSRLAASKNVGLLLDLAARWPERQLVLAGGDSPYAQEVARQIEQRGLQSNVHLFLDVSDAQKAWLFAHCDAFLFPSQAEGFGLPPIEAMHFGKPVFLSTLTSLPEIGGSSAFYVDPLDAATLQAAIEHGLAAHTPARAAAVAAHAATFNWDDCAAAYLRCYGDWLGGGS